MSEEKKRQSDGQGGSLFSSARTLRDRLRDMASGLDRNQMAALARIVAAVLLFVALYNGYLVLSHFIG